jgi:cell division protein FtsB
VSEPKRYAFKVNEENDFDLIEHSNGEYVLYEDYARLKAECQARQAENSVLAVECDSLKAEVERLTDEVGLINQLWEKYLTPEIRKAIVNAAKKGGQQ